MGASIVSLLHPPKVVSLEPCLCTVEKQVPSHFWIVASTWCISSCDIRTPESTFKMWNSSVNYGVQSVSKSSENYLNVSDSAPLKWAFCNTTYLIFFSKLILLFIHTWHVLAFFMASCCSRLAELEKCCPRWLQHTESTRLIRWCYYVRRCIYILLLPELKTRHVWPP